MLILSMHSEPIAAKQSQKVLYRILDANLDRAREGLRIIEEWCRFGLNDATLTEQIKYLRQTLGGWHSDDIRQSRDTPGDLGTALSHPQEEQRDTMQTVVKVNCCRVQEALRVLEEYGKLHASEMATGAKQMRYQLYTLESKLLGHNVRQLLAKARTYLVTSPHDRLLDVVESALKGGIDIVQYREKQADDDVRLELASKIKALCHQYDSLFIVNDRVDIAAAVGADGVHLGQQDLPMAAARRILGPLPIVGRSTTNSVEMARAIDEGADYIGVGPVYATPTKPGKAAAGYDYIRYAVENAPMPWFAIGGIDLTNVALVRDAGAPGVAIVRAIMQADDPLQITRSFNQHFE
ncbi:thiamine phosphate synthase [Leptolyngbyaceae cyanobacterium CCMR0082]|uniref:Thiamine-phosphate synthase n=3 Tax=Adonisia TaxID=2950183 RepID=A0A6M0S4E9_9CYAN|nr:thiamine phosphate synthase [Adonisia turfae]NEZ55620.1 thiamine phosphate synthase [Adonisia turfae CCMR0081]NEZ63399.1 thiamine phosphate synthase [Adonisia turfae CCMR0082]